MVKPDSFWEDKNGEWTIASQLVKRMFFEKTVKPEESLYILATLGVKERFDRYWNYPEFLQRLGLVHLAVDAVDKTFDGWRTKQGDFAWVAGDMNAALRYYEESIRHRDSTHSGYGGKFRICFVEKQFEECLRIFRELCPPHSFYIEYNSLSYKDYEYGSDYSQAMEVVSSKYKGTSPYFITDARYMLQAVVFAAVNAGDIDDKLREMISDYFEVSEKEVDELVTSSRGNEKEFVRLKKRVEPKPQETDATFDGIIERGCTDKAKNLCEKLRNYEQIIEETRNSTVSFLQNGDEAMLDEIINFNPPFGLLEADGIIFREAFAPIQDQMSQTPELQLILMRRFNRICGYPEGRNMCHSGTWIHEGGFCEVFRNIMLNTNSKMLPSDILLGIMNINWYEEDVFADRKFVSQNFEWCNAMLGDYVDSLGRDFLKDENRFILALYETYKYLYARYEAAQNKQIWINEELLAEAIKSLFGKDNVMQHANPIWLSPQHLDIYLPSYNLAIEYMGKQHYEAIDFFGGEKAFIENQKRDKRKADLCARMNVNLVYVTYEEDIGKRAREIFELCG